MGPDWRGSAGAVAAVTLRKRTEGARYLLGTLLLLLFVCGFWTAGAQTDDGLSVYFWETGTELN